MEVEQSWPPDEGLQSGEIFSIRKDTVEVEQSWPPDEGLQPGEIFGILKNAVDVEQRWPPDKGLQSGEILDTASEAATPEIARVRDFLLATVAEIPDMQPEHIRVTREIIWAEFGCA